eukprot:CAMPEP_0185925576 /NCGR_PEP_ID=MMETSP0924C-20121207/13939_1 /TAXON_ID=321610 /ORGANISM="Perkinsus chesapeaki, Strain ATCC PRA-65" /LENGTH=56 /DNA_ID=CAMNT_0028662497 /DNA_START=21 /DNA_END=191 /DNA_ORIENTATION=-
MATTIPPSLRGGEEPSTTSKDVLTTLQEMAKNGWFGGMSEEYELFYRPCSPDKNYQ